MDDGYLLVDTRQSSSTRGQAMVVVYGDASPAVPDFRTALTWWTQRLIDGRWRHVPDSDTWGGGVDEMLSQDPVALERRSDLV